MCADPSRPLVPLRFPLHGSRLIEASAGTGKTFTIAALYVRLVLGHGDEAGFARALTPPEILVMTFTDAATQELRERIRARLAEAAEYFRADPAAVCERVPGEDLLHDLRADYPPAAWPGCARRLQLAAEWMDEAAVSTIHGWCNRMLREHAFDSGSLFTQRLEADQGELVAEVVRDFWRTHFYPLEAADVAETLQWWRSPDALQRELAGLVGHADALPDAAAPAQSLRAARDARARRLAALKAPWAAWSDELQALLDAAVAAKAIDGRKLKKANYDRWLASLREWAADAAAVRPDLKTGWTRLTRDGLAEVWKGGAPPEHPALAALRELPAALDALPDARAALLAFAARWVAARLAIEQARRAQMGFNDLLTRLAAALEGPNGARLAALIRAQFPAALIDEFQDTDAVQYRILDAVYRVADNAPETALVLIGDPKQAIYAFRGADIYTYLAARRACAGRLYTLTTNFRSSAAMVAAVNRCFAQAESRAAGAGAFLFRDGGDNPLPFVPVAAKGRAARLVVADAPVAALNCWLLAADAAADALGKGAYVERMAAVCAGEIVRLLNLGRARRAGFTTADGAPGALVALRPADIAVLVANRIEADAVRAALAAAGVRSVYLSDKESVFASPQAGELQRWLAACAEPDDGRLLRAALASATLGLDWAALDRLERDELAWEARVLQFRDYRERWRRQGVLPMLRRLLGDFGVPARLLASADGERALTDLLHLAELLQQASSVLDGEHALIRHLAEQRRDGGSGVALEARKPRLESDADLVQIVTVHKSKGLEYPLVFLPFACTFREIGAQELPLKWHDDDGRLQLALAADDARLARADRERLGEDLRKLYVALTRARYATWIGVAPLAGLERSALGYLLGGGAPLDAAALAEALTALQQGCADIAIVADPQPVAARYVADADPAAPGEARTPRRAAREHWWIASYSALAGGAGAVLTATAAGVPAIEAPAEPVAVEVGALRHVGDTADEDTFAETMSEPAGRVVAPSSADDASLHRFPRGPEAGTFLHDLLEWAAHEGFATAAAMPPAMREALARRCALRGWPQWATPLAGWLHDFVTTPLALPRDETGGATLCLAALTSLQVEMEFWVAARHVDTARLDALVRAHTLDGVARPALRAGALNGMLKGFVDLVFEHRGRYYVADYKSNWLGPDDGAYTREAMRAAVVDKRYDLQYVLYLFALHRLLSVRLPDYDYDRHVGGALYLFLRGSRAPTRGLHFERPPRALIDALDRLFAGAPDAMEDA